MCAGGADGLLGAKGFEAPVPLDWDGADGAAAPSSGSGERSGAAAEASTSGRGFEEAERRFRGCVPPSLCFSLFCCWIAFCLLKRELAVLSSCGRSSLSKREQRHTGRPVHAHVLMPPVVAVPRRTWQRQYMFVAATMPSGAGSSVAGDLRRMFPDLFWLSGNSLHMAQARVAHTWLPVTADSWQQALQVLLRPCLLLSLSSSQLPHYSPCIMQAMLRVFLCVLQSRAPCVFACAGCYPGR